jgi:hypothetical protein
MRSLTGMSGEAGPGKCPEVGVPTMEVRPVAYNEPHRSHRNWRRPRKGFPTAAEAHPGIRENSLS